MKVNHPISERSFIFDSESWEQYSRDIPETKEEAEVSRLLIRYVGAKSEPILAGKKEDFEKAGILYFRL